MNWIPIAEEGIVISDRIVAVAPAETAPMRRLLAMVPITQLVLLTGGQRRQTVLLLDSGHVVITALSVDEVERLLWQSRLVT